MPTVGRRDPTQQTGLGSLRPHVGNTVGATSLFSGHCPIYHREAEGGKRASRFAIDGVQRSISLIFFNAGSKRPRDDGGEEGKRGKEGEKKSPVVRSLLLEGKGSGEGVKSERRGEEGSGVGAGAGGDGGKTGGEEAPPAKKAKRESVKQEPLPGAEAKSGTQSSIPLKQRASPGAKQVGCLPQPETQNSKPETRNLKPETRNPKPESPRRHIVNITGGVVPSSITSSTKPGTFPASDAPRDAAGPRENGEDRELLAP